MTFALHVVPSYGTPFTHILHGNSLTIGRSSSSDLVIDDEVVSRTHARLFKEGQAWFAEDLNSHNGTWLNGKRVDRPMAIGLGDVIRLSGTVITVQDALISSDSVSSGPRQSRELFKSMTELLNHESSASMMEERDIHLLRRRAERFKLLNEIHIAISTPATQEQIIEQIIDRIFEHLRPEGCTFFLREEDGSAKAVAERRARERAGDQLSSRHLERQVMDDGMAALIHDAPSDERFSEAKSIVAAGIRSLLAAPLMDSEGAMGMIVLTSNSVARLFSEDDMAMLVSIASVAALRLRNIKLTEDATKRLLDTNRMLESKVRQRTSELEDRNREVLRTRDQLIMREKMASLGRLTAGIAHELRNPLNFVNNFAEICIDFIDDIQTIADVGMAEEKRPELMEVVGELRENINYISDHGRRADHVVQSMMELSRDESGSFQETDINNLVSEFVQLSYRSFKAKNDQLDIKVEENYDTSIGLSQVSTYNLGRALVNLMNNAIEAVIARMAIENEDYQAKISVWTKSVNDALEVGFWDNGIGIPPDNMDSIYTPFFTTKPSGRGNIGLGLSIVYDVVVTEHQGDIDITSESAEYTRAVVTIPRQDREDEEPTIDEPHDD